MNDNTPSARDEGKANSVETISLLVLSSDKGIFHHPFPQIGDEWLYLGI